MTPRRTPQRLKWVGLFASVWTALIFTPTDVFAEDIELARYGGRAGSSIDPDQLVLGAYAGLGELTTDLQLRPSFDIGFGDHLFSAILNADIQYFYQVEGLRPRTYGGLGLGIGYYNFESGSADNSTTEVGLNLFQGAEWNLGNYRTTHVELRFGIDELPDIKLIGGIGLY